jgi:SAM-dependent methyltransferase
MKDFCWKIIQLRMKRWTRAGLYDFIEENLKLHKSEKILVIGGFGQVLNLINKKIPNKNVKTLDIQLAHRPDYLLDISDPSLIGLIQEKFDQIICIEVLEHVPNYELALSNIYKLLNNNGVIIASTPWVIPLHDQPYDFHRFTWFEIKRILQKNNFEEILIECRGNYVDSIFALGVRGLLSPSLSGKITSIIFTLLTLFLPKPKRYSKLQYSTIGYSFKAKKLLS